MGDFWRYVAALVPSTGVGFLFYLVIKAMIEGDRRERHALAQWEAANQLPEASLDVPDQLSRPSDATVPAESPEPTEPTDLDVPAPNGNENGAARRTDEEA